VEHSWLYEFAHDFAGPFATSLAAIAAAGITLYFNRAQTRIAREQANTAKQQAELAVVRLQHDLFERRIAVFDAARDLLLEVFEKANISDAAMIAFTRGTEKAVFLFNKDVTDYITKMRNTGGALQLAVARLSDESLPIGPERTEFALLRAQYSQWFVDQFDALIPIFMPALALEKHIATRLAKPSSAAQI